MNEGQEAGTNPGPNPVNGQREPANHDRPSSVRPTVAVGPHNAPGDELSQLLSLSTPRGRGEYERLAALSAASKGTGLREGWGPGDSAELDALLAEYATLRQETMNTINNRTQILILGLAAIAALAGGSLTS